MARITVVNNHPEFLELMRDILESDRYDATTVDGTRDDALELVRASRPDLLIIDLRLGAHDLHGWDIAQQARADPLLGRLPVLVCSADRDALREVEDDLAEVHDVEALVKPFAIEELLAAVDRLLAESAPR